MSTTDAPGGRSDQPLFEWPEGSTVPPSTGVDVTTLIEIERAAASVVEPVSNLWREVASSAEASVSPQSLEEMLRNSLQTMAELLSVNTVSILLANEAEDELVVRAAIGLREEVTVGLGIRAGEGMAGRVLASRRPLIVGDLSTIHVVNAALRESGLRSVVAVPLLSGGRTLGVLYAASYEQDRFTAGDARLLEVVADRLAAALDRVRLFEQERNARREAAFFARAAQVLAEAVDLSSTLDRLADLAVGVLGDICLIDVVGEDGTIVRMAAKHRDPMLQPAVDRLRTEFPPDPAGGHPGVVAIAEGRASWSSTMSDAFMRGTTVSDAHFQLIKSLGFRSYVTVPLVAQRRVVGAVTCVSTTRPFTTEDMTFAEQLGYRVAAVVDNAQRYESAFRTSQILQSSLLPGDVPDIGGLDVDVRYLTANRGIEVGGDFYDVVSLPGGGVLFVIGDVAGHDRSAAAQMGRVRSAARALAGRADGPGELVASVRESWELLGVERMVTALFGLLDPGSGDVAIVSAGHYAPLLVSTTGASFLPVRPGPPLGVDLEAPSRGLRPLELEREWHGRLSPAEVLLCYTDGAIDERNAGPERSMAQLADIASAGSITPAAVCDRVVGTLEQAQARTDDVALLAVALATR